MAELFLSFCALLYEYIYKPELNQNAQNDGNGPQPLNSF